MSVYDLENERGRYIHVNRPERLCKICYNYVEDEFHFIFICKAYNDLREIYIPVIYTSKSDIHALNNFMSNNEHIFT